MIERKEGFYLQKDGQKETHKTFYTLYQPVSTKPKATLLILHGMKEHSGRYDEVARFFTEKGFCGIDLRPSRSWQNSNQ